MCIYIIFLPFFLSLSLSLSLFLSSSVPNIRYHRGGSASFFRSICVFKNVALRNLPSYETTTTTTTATTTMTTTRADRPFPSLFSLFLGRSSDCYVAASVRLRPCAFGYCCVRAPIGGHSSRRGQSGRSMHLYPRTPAGPRLSLSFSLRFAVRMRIHLYLRLATA